MALNAAMYVNMANLSNLSAASLTTLGTGLACTGTAIVGGVVGVATAGYMEIKLQEFEQKCKIGTYKVRFWTAQGLRTIFVGGGIGLTTAAAMGLISSSIVVTVGVASAGIGVAVVFALAIGYGFARYQNMSAKMAQMEREEAARVLMPDIDNVSDDDVRNFIKSHKLTIVEMGPHLMREPNSILASQRFARVHRLTMGGN